MSDGVHNPLDPTGIFAYLGAIFLEVMHLDGDFMRGTDDAALAADWTAALATALANYTAVRAGYLDELDFNLQGAIAALQTDLDNPGQYMADVSALALEATLGTHDTDIKALLAAITPAGPTKSEMDTGHGLLATEAKQDIIDTNVDQIEVLVATTVMGRAQIAVEEADFDSVAVGDWAMLVGTGQDVVIESLVFHCARDLSGDAGFTGISIQTTATTPQVFIPQAEGVKANLTAESQLAWTGAILLKADSYIDLSIYGGAIANAVSIVQIIATYRAVVSGGYVA